MQALRALSVPSQYCNRVLRWCLATKFTGAAAAVILRTSQDLQGRRRAATCRGAQHQASQTAPQTLPLTFNTRVYLRSIFATSIRISAVPNRNNTNGDNVGLYTALSTKVSGGTTASFAQSLSTKVSSADGGTALGEALSTKPVHAALANVLFLLRN